MSFVWYIFASYITTETPEMPSIRRNHSELAYANKLDELQEIRNNLPRLNHEEIEGLNKQ
jgi:hypothetical protein